MIRNYLKIALRTLWKHKKLTAINVFGLATGISASLLIALYVQDERSYDNHHRDADRIHRVVKDFINDDGTHIPDATTPGPLAGAMQREIPEVEVVTRVHPEWGGTIRFQYEDTEISEPRVWRVDSSFFDVFTVPFLRGDTKTALADINSVVLTESAAKRYFGDADPIGKTLRMNRNDDVTVTAVIADVPPQSHFHYDILLSYRRLPPNAHTNWYSYNYYTYVKVRPGTDMAVFDSKIQDLYERHIDDFDADFYTQPVTDIHLTSKLKWELEPNGDRLYVTVFTLIGVFIIIIAGINYVNLATARSALRAKEIGIRKVSGAERRTLVMQLLMESLVLCAFSTILAVIIAWLVLPFVNSVTQKQLVLDGSPVVILVIVAAALLIGLVAGLFPALYLSSFRPVAVLKGFKLNDQGALNLRKSLVVVQFTISVALITGALVIMKQVKYIRSADLGFDKAQVLVINNARSLSQADRSAFLNTINTFPGVGKAATSGTVLGRGFNTTFLNAKGSDQEQQLNFTYTGYDYLDVVGIDIIEGRGFSRDFPADTLNNGIPGGPLDQRLGGIILNERAVKAFGLGDPAVGKQLVWSNDGDTAYHVEVVGVAKDFHFTSLRNEIKPYGFVLLPRAENNFTIKLSGDIAGTLQQLETAWRSSFPEIPFEYFFLDETFDRMYAAEARFQQVFVTLVVLGIIIACLGLFALATFSAEQRIREIGIRKVLGATVTELVMLLSKDFLKLVIISIVIAVPLAWYLMGTWLDNFAYHITPGWTIFAGAALMAVVIAWLTISSQAIRAAMTNPVKNLRSE